jgi:hypothetical protein
MKLHNGYLALAFSLLFLVGCMEQMSNDQIIAECKKCEEAGLEARSLRYGGDSFIIGIQCIPKGDTKRGY